MSKQVRDLKRNVAALIAALFLALVATAARAHTELPTLVLVKVAPQNVQVKIDMDLTLMLGSQAAYFAFVGKPEQVQQQTIRKLLPRVLDDLRLSAGRERLKLKLDRFTPAKGDRNEFVGDASTGKRSTLELSGPPLASRAPLRLTIPEAAYVEFPIAFTVQTPATGFSLTSWLVVGMHGSDPVDWTVVPPSQDAGFSEATDQTSSTRADSSSWWRQLPEYLYLGFRHIVPEGVDHILFVLGLFFLGLSWRKLLSQTTVFTVAHATTLFLSTYGIFSLPAQYVEPLIALSIAFIGFENVFRPNLGPSRLAIVFAFGLIHGLGFAASLNDVPFSEHDFLWALLGFNFGVDLGQLFVMAVAFIVVGWFRHRPWFQARIANPASILIAVIGLYWACTRIIMYSDRYWS